MPIENINTTNMLIETTSTNLMNKGHQDVAALIYTCASKAPTYVAFLRVPVLELSERSYLVHIFLMTRERATTWARTEGDEDVWCRDASYDVEKGCLAWRLLKDKNAMKTSKNRGTGSRRQ